jgi:hypothetical protein
MVKKCSPKEIKFLKKIIFNMLPNLPKFYVDNCYFGYITKLKKINSQQALQLSTYCFFFLHWQLTKRALCMQTINLANSLFK